MLPQALRLDRPEGDAHNASAVKKLSAWVFFFERGERFFTALAPRHALCRV